MHSCRPKLTFIWLHSIVIICIIVIGVIIRPIIGEGEVAAITSNFWTRNWSHIATHLFVAVLFVATSSKKPRAPSFQMKFAGIVLIYASIDGVWFFYMTSYFKMVAMQSAAILWVLMQRPPATSCIRLLLHASLGCPLAILSTVPDP